MWKNCEGFIFARTDWEYVTNTFIFPVNIGYHFIATKNGAMNGQLCGIGADAANRCIVVDEIQPMGLLITNGQFVAFEGENPIRDRDQPDLHRLGSAPELRFLGTGRRRTSSPTARASCL